MFGEVLRLFSMMLTWFQDFGQFLLNNLSSTFGVLFAVGISLFVARLFAKILVG